jgi:hypothetical protein
MSSLSREELLRPSLSGAGRPSVAPYSQATVFMSAFFGGPFASAAMIAINAKRLGRLQRDAAWALLLVAVLVAWLYFLVHTESGNRLFETMAGLLGKGSVALSERLIAVLGALGGMWLHRGEQRTADLFGLTRPNGWIAGIALVVFGYLATFLLHRSLV